jgi:hypothetical protein
MPQFSIFASLNHIHHHTYFKNPYVHIQVLHILHHHTMKLLQVIESFMPGRPIVEIGSKNWLAAGRTVRQRKLVCCWRHNFSSECYFVAANMFLVANANSLQTTQLRQRVTNSLQTTQFRQRISNSLQTIQLRQWTPNSL